MYALPAIKISKFKKLISVQKYHGNQFCKKSEKEISVEGKSNEIPAVQQLIRELDIHGCMVVADALNRQRETVEANVRGKGNYLLDAKGNQPALEEEIRDYVQDEGLILILD